MRSLDIRILCLIVGLAGMSACGTSQPTRYYLLSSAAPDTTSESVQGELTIGVGPIILPPYLDRREIVSRTSNNELSVAIYDQWGEALHANVSRVIGENLGQRLATDRIIRLPVKRSLRSVLVFDYQVTIAVKAFEKTPDGSVMLNARWAVLDNNKTELVLRRSVYSQVPSAEGYAAQVAAQSQLLGQLSEEIAAAILKLNREGRSDNRGLPLP